MKNNPFFSIIVPVYNVEKYINQCIESLLSQTFPSYEIILIDDGSTDQSGELCNQYAHDNPEFIQVIHQKNGGLSHARNVGMENAKGEYILFLDSDDYFLDSNVLTRIRNVISFQDMIAFEWKEIVNGKISKNSKIHFQLENTGRNFDWKIFLTKLLTLHPGMPWYSWMYAYKREFLQKNHLIFQKGRSYEDSLMTPSALLKAETISVLNYPVYGYCVGRGGSITASATLKNLSDYLYAVEFNIKLVTNNKEIDTNLKKKMLSNFSMGYFAIMINAGVLPTYQDKKHMIALLQQKQYIADYCLGMKQKLVNRFMKTFGIESAIYILNFRRLFKLYVSNIIKD